VADIAVGSRARPLPEPTTEQVQAFTATTWVLLGLDALLGLAILRGRWRRSQALQPTGAAPAPPRPNLG
jgi:hypothetical protein